MAPLIRPAARPTSRLIRAARGNRDAVNLHHAPEEDGRQAADGSHGQVHLADPDHDHLGHGHDPRDGKDAQHDKEVVLGQKSGCDNRNQDHGQNGEPQDGDPLGFGHQIGQLGVAHYINPFRRA